MRFGAVEVECLHTPGHTAGSQCFRCGQKLIAGDTLFLQGCGRLDLPGGSVEEMWKTLTERMATLPDDLELFPGHDYSGKSAPLGEIRRTMIPWRWACSTALSRSRARARTVGITRGPRATASCRPSPSIQLPTRKASSPLTPAS